MPTEISNEFQVNTYTINDQYSPQITPLPNGNFVVVWQSSSDGSGSGTYGQVFDASSTKVGGEFQINTYTVDTQASAQITSLPNGNFVVVWESNLQDGSDYGVYGQIFDGNGTKIGGEFRVNTYTANRQGNPQIITLSNGNFVVAWESSLQDGSDYGIYSQVFDESGAKVGIEFRVNTVTANRQDSPQIIPLSNGNFVAAWVSNLQDGSGSGTYGQVFDSSGAKVEAEFRVNTYTMNSQTYPQLTPLPNSNFVVVWNSNLQDGSGSGTYGQVFGSSGVKIGIEFRVNTFTTDDQWFSQITTLPNGNFVVVWISDLQDGSGSGIYGQVFDSSGTKVGGEFRVNTYTVDAQNNHQITPLSNDNFVVVWNSDLQDGSLGGVYAQVFNGNGTKVGAEFKVNAYTANDQYNPRIITLSNGNFVVVWVSNLQDGSDYGIYGRVFYGGNLMLTNSVQAINYTEDSISTPWNSLAILSPGTLANARLTLSDPVAGILTTSTSGNVTSTYDPATGTWQAGGAVNDVNGVLGAVQYIPPANYHQDFTIAINVTDSYSPPVNGTLSLMGIPINDMPVLVNNQMTILNRQTLVLSTANLSATDVDGFIGSLQFIISNVKGGHFELVTNPGTKIFSFTQQQVMDGQVQFVQDGSAIVSYEVSVSDGQLSTQPIPATITFTHVNDPPVLVINQLTIDQGATVIITEANLLVDDPDNTTFIFILSQIKGGHFELASARGNEIMSFSSDQIASREVLFVQDGSETFPAYQVQVSDGEAISNPVGANVTFINQNNAPTVLLPPDSLTVEANKDFSFTLNATKIFEDPDGDPLTYRAELEDNRSPWPNWLHFNAEETPLLEFVGNAPKSANNTRISLIAADPNNKTTHTEFSILTQNQNVAQNVTEVLPADYRLAIGFSTAAGVTGLAGFIGVGFWYRKRSANTHTRQGYPLADYVRTALSLQGVDNFETETGHHYVQFIERMSQELVQTHGWDQTELEGNDKNRLQGIAGNIADALREQFPRGSDWLGRSRILATDLSLDKVTVIAQRAHELHNQFQVEEDLAYTMY